jgi:anti-sigma factor (TIGR02949 family)
MGSGKHEAESCREVFALLSEYLDHELSAETCEEIEAHLAGCAPCIEFLNSLKRTVKLCHNCESGEAPRPLSAGEREQLLSAYRTYLAGSKHG